MWSSASSRSIGRRSAGAKSCTDTRPKTSLLQVDARHRRASAGTQSAVWSPLKKTPGSNARRSTAVRSSSPRPRGRSTAPNRSAGPGRSARRAERSCRRKRQRPPTSLVFYEGGDIERRARLGGGGGPGDETAADLDQSGPRRDSFQAQTGLIQSNLQL